jgi:hypothetical protein
MSARGAVVWVRDGGRSSAPLFARPPRADPPAHAQFYCRDHLERRTPEYERVIARMGPFCRTPGPERCCPNSCRSAMPRQWRRRVGGPCATAGAARPMHSPSAAVTCARVRRYQVCSFEVMLAQISNDDGKQVVLSRLAPSRRGWWHCFGFPGMSGGIAMDCVCCGSPAVTERPDLIVQGGSGAGTAASSSTNVA